MCEPGTDAAPKPRSRAALLSPAVCWQSLCPWKPACQPPTSKHIPFASSLSLPRLLTGNPPGLHLPTGLSLEGWGWGVSAGGR